MFEAQTLSSFPEKRAPFQSFPKESWVIFKHKKVHLFRCLSVKRKESIEKKQKGPTLKRKGFRAEEKRK